MVPDSFSSGAAPAVTWVPWEVDRGTSTARAVSDRLRGRSDEPLAPVGPALL